MNYHHLCLQIKLKHLAFESKLIATEKNKALQKHNYADAQSLHNHRMLFVRPEARHTHLAYGLLRGLPYSAMEKTSHEPPKTSEVLRMVKKYGKYSWDEKNILSWLSGATVEAIDKEIAENWQKNAINQKLRFKRPAFLA